MKEENQDTLALMDEVKFDFAYMFYYSERPGTPAAKKYTDDIPLDIKQRRLEEVIARQRAHGLESNTKDLGKVFKVLVEGFSKRSDQHLQGRNTHNKVVIFPKGNHKKGEYVNVLIDDYTSGSLLGKVIN